MESYLVNLKAEVQRQRSDIKKFGVKNRDEKKKNKLPFLKSNKGVSSRAAKDEILNEQEKKTLSKSRAILEQKAALYDKIHGGTDVLEDSDLNEKYLVNFQKKIINDVLNKNEEKEKEDTTNYPAQNSEEEWVEYTDALGRSRMCQRKDLQSMQEQDDFITGGNAQTKEPLTVAEEAYNAEMKYRETQRLKWEKEEEELMNKDKIHYSDVLFDEARTHGTGFMKFSKDEAKRKEEQDYLKDLQHQHSVAATAKAKADKEKDKLMKARLDKVRERKRLKLGLPIKINEYESPPPSEDEEEIGPPLPPSFNENKPEENKDTNKETKMREWDLGKESINKPMTGWIRQQQKPPMTQEEWVNKNRKDRNPDFAPPTIYESNSYKKDKYFKEHKKAAIPFSYEENSQEQQEEPKRNWEFAPPATFDYYGPSNSNYKKPKHNHIDIEKSIQKGLSEIRKNL